MTQTNRPTDGVFLEPSEFYYLLRMNHAARVIGLEDQELLPPPGPAAETLLQAGFALLREHDWLKPAERGRFDLNPELALLAAVVADPQFVVVAARALNESEVAQANHYLGADLIVELTLTPDRQVRLAFEQDRPTLLRRVEELLAAAHNPLPPARYTLPEPKFESIQSAARAGGVDAAAGQLVVAGFDQAHARSLAQALQTGVGDGRLVVVRVLSGEILGGRKAETHAGAAGSWLSRREDSTTLDLSLETVQAGTVSGVVDSYLQSLSVLPERVQ